jgi:tRNA nucleotidyltransferase (CCA-adding enzyme)
LRGVRLEQRLNLNFEDNTLRLLHSAVKGGLLGKLSSPRVRVEVEIDAKERQPQKVFERMQALGIWEALFPGLHFGPSAVKKMKYLQKILYRIRKLGKISFKGMEWLAYIAAVCSESSTNVRVAVMDRLNFTPKEREIFTACLSSVVPVEQFFGAKKTFKNSEVYLFLKNYSPVVLLYCMAAVRRRQTRRWLSMQLFSFAPLKGELKGEDLLKLGYSPGAWLGEMLEGIRLERMDGKIKTRDDEVLYLQEMLRRD